jgi:DNA-binding NarL/FixJ family response regulator
MGDRIPVFIVEDQAAVLRNVVKMLATFPDVEVVGTAFNAEDALIELPRSGARVALVDVELPGKDGLTLVAELKAAAVVCELLVFTSFVDEQKVFEAMRRGAAGYLVKGASSERLRAALQTVDDGGTVIEPRLAKTFWNYFKGVQAPASAESTFTADEIGLLELMAKGLSNAEAAQVLGLQRRNVRTRLQKIYDKLGARSHVDAVVVALKRGLISI